MGEEFDLNLVFTLSHVLECRQRHLCRGACSDLSFIAFALFCFNNCFPILSSSLDQISPFYVSFKIISDFLILFSNLFLVFFHFALNFFVLHILFFVRSNITFLPSFLLFSTFHSLFLTFSASLRFLLLPNLFMNSFFPFLLNH